MAAGGLEEEAEKVEAVAVIHFHSQLVSSSTPGPEEHHSESLQPISQPAIKFVHERFVIRIQPCWFGGPTAFVYTVG
jgi:hypothetical protein